MACVAPFCKDLLLLLAHARALSSLSVPLATSNPIVAGVLWIRLLLAESDYVPVALWKVHWMVRVPHWIIQEFWTA